MTTPPAGPITALIAFPLLEQAIDRAAFEVRFGDRVRLLVEPYRVEHAEFVERTERPAAAAAAGEELTPAQRAAFAEATVVATLALPLDIARVAPKLRWVQGIGSGIGQFAASGVERIPGLVTTNAAGIVAPSIAEWVVATLFGIYKRLPEHAELQRARTWRSATGSVVAGRTVAVVGLGAIGSEVAWRLAALGLNVIGVRRTPADAAPVPTGVIELHHPDELIDVVARCDAVVAAIPGTPANADLFDAELFAAMRQGSVFLNVGRGSLVDEAALVDALRSGHLRGAAIDVAKHEPPTGDDPLWSAPNLVISPHSSASVEGYMEGCWALFCDNLERFLAGEPLRNVVDVPATYGTPTSN